jgi:hypothetical protein
MVVSIREPAVLVIEVPSLLSATLSGCLLGPRATRATTGREFISTILLMTLAVEILGAILVGVAIVVAMVLASPVLADAPLASLLLAGPVIGLAGALIVGPLAYLPLVLASTSWLFVVQWLSRRLARSTSTRAGGPATPRGKQPGAPDDRP